MMKFLHTCLGIFTLGAFFAATPNYAAPSSDSAQTMPQTPVLDGVDSDETSGLTLNSISELSDRIKIDGFLSVNVSKSDVNMVPSTLVAGNRVTPTYNGIGRRYDFFPGSLIGLQLTGNIQENTDVILQLVGKGFSKYPNVDNYEINTTWAFLRYQHNEFLTAKVGRVIIPTYMLSQYTNIAFAYPWIEPPQEIYGLFEIPSVNGAIFTLSKDLPYDWHVDVEPFIGVTKYQNAVGSLSIDVNIHNVYGVGGQISNGDFKLVGMFARGQIELNGGNPIQLGGGISTPAYKHAGYFYSFGTQFDNSQVMVMAEFSKAIRMNGYYPDMNAWYVMSGFHLGKFTPFVTYAELLQTNKSRLNQLSAAARAVLSPAILQEQNSISVGLRYDVSPKIAFKGSISQVTPLNGSRGLFSVVPNQRHVMVYRLGVNAIF